MKKLLIWALAAGITGLSACNSGSGTPPTVGADQNAEQLDGNQTGIVNPDPNDTTGATATEKTQTGVGNSSTRGEQNNTKSTTTQNQVLRDSM